MKVNTYNNFIGEQTTPTPKGGAKFDLISAGANAIIGLVSGSISAKKNRELQEKLAKLSLKQQKELQELLLSTQSETDRLTIMYKTFGVLNNQKLLDEQKNKQLMLYYFLGGGSILLVAMAIYYKGKKNKL